MSNPKIHTARLMNYELKSSGLTNYLPTESSSSPESFPNMMKDGILVDYQTLDFVSEITENKPETGKEIKISDSTKIK